MTMNTLLAAVTICGFVTLTGCATKPTAKTDTAPPSAAMTTPSTAVATPASIPSPANTEEKADGAMTDSLVAESGPKAGVETEHAGNAKSNNGLDTVYFGFDAYLLSADARDSLTGNARLLNEKELTRVIIEGHADERGSDDYNLALAEKRAAAARRYLESLGVDADRMQTVSYGEDKPAAIGNDEAAWAKNRRVDFVIVK